MIPASQANFCHVLPAGPASIMHVLRNLRAVPDGLEVATLARPCKSVEALAWRFIQADHVAAVSRIFAVRPDAVPAAYFAVHETAREVGIITFLATDRFAEIAFAVSQWLRQAARRLLEAEFKRVEVRALADPRSIAWLTWLGGVEECRLDDYGPNGETFVQIAWRREASCASAR